MIDVSDPRFTDAALRRLRLVGDEPADALARALLTAYADEGLTEAQVMGRAIRAVVAGTASADDDVLAWLWDGPDLPEWADPGLMAVGQRFFRSWPMPIATALFCAALPTAYAAPHGAAVLMATSQLSQQRTVARRLAETGQMLFDVMDFSGSGGSGLQPGGQGYLSVRGVRLLHAVVRQGLLSREAEPWPREHGVPINQEDLLGTLFTFTVNVLRALERLGVPVGGDEARGYLHVWCVVGALLGIDGSLLPLTPDQARAGAEAIAARQLGPSPAGRALVGELLEEMRLAMPRGWQDLPAALVHRLVPDVARMLEVPAVPVRWRGLLGASCGLARRARLVPGMTRLAEGPLALVGRSVLRMFVDRELHAGEPTYRLDADVLRRATGGGGRRRIQRRTRRRRGRGDGVGVGPHVAPSRDRALAPLTRPIDLPILPDEVRLIASEGFPLWEPVEVMVERNRRATIGYADLSVRLAELIAGGDDVLDANWCTFATWGSKTIGTCIECIPGSDGAAPTGPLPGAAIGGPLAGPLVHVARQVMTRCDAASFRTLAAGNRVVFLEIGLAIATFLERFPDRSAALGPAGEKRWGRYWSTVLEQLEALSSLDPSWLLTPCPPPRDLQLGLRQYFEALRTDPADRELRSQRVLAGSLLLGAYEQRRVDGYDWTALALFTERAMRRLIRDRTGALGGVRRWPSNLYARLMTHRMTLDLPGGEVIRLGQPIPPPPDPWDVWHELATDAGVTLPVLQALITRFQLAAGRRPDRGARNWTSFDERMRTIGTLFRQRQRQQSLFTDPFDPDETARLLAGTSAGGNGASSGPAAGAPVLTGSASVTTS